jgi:hypothetical protein
MLTEDSLWLLTGRLLGETFLTRFLLGATLAVLQVQSKAM